VEYVLAALIGYLLGSVPVAVLVARRHGVDLHAVGDRNPGAWNALDHLGARRAWPAFAGDGLKGLLAGLAGLALGPWWAGWAGVAGAMAGHALPLFARGRGGKSVMTFAGGMCALSTAAAGIAVAGCLLVTAATSFRHGARVAVFGFPLVQLVTDPVGHVMGTGVLMCLIGLLFVTRRRSPVPSTSAPGAAPTSSAARPRADQPGARARRRGRAGRTRRAAARAGRRGP
jgi:glycerol-3-phosphate acyltransferase PlsY